MTQAIQFRDDQLPYVNDNTSKFAICLGGNGSGKSLCSAKKTVDYLATLPPRAGSKFLVIGEETYVVCQCAWVEKLSTYLPEELICQIYWHNAKRKHPRKISLWHPLVGGQDSWVIEFMSHEQFAKFPAHELIGGFWIEEEIPFALAEKAVQHLEPWGRGWADFTPVKYLCDGWYDACLNIPEGWKFHQLSRGIDDKFAKKFMTGLEGLPRSVQRNRMYGSFPTKH